MLEFATQVTYSHVKAHAGEPWNEAADSIASRTRTGDLLPSSFPASLLGDLADCEWLWLACQAMVGNPSFPQLAGKQLCVGLPSPALDQQGRTRAFVRHGIRLAQQQTRAQLQLKLASANVLTLAPGSRLRKRLQKCGVGVALGLNVTARAEFLRAEFERLEYVAIGLQETRLALNGVHSTPNFVAVYAAADKGQLGVALWLSRTCAHGSDAVGPCFFAPHNVACSWETRACLLSTFTLASCAVT